MALHVLIVLLGNTLDQQVTRVKIVLVGFIHRKREVYCAQVVQLTALLPTVSRSARHALPTEPVFQDQPSANAKKTSSSKRANVEIVLLIFQPSMALCFAAARRTSFDITTNAKIALLEQRVATD